MQAVFNNEILYDKDLKVQVIKNLEISPCTKCAFRSREDICLKHWLCWTDSDNDLNHTFKNIE